MIAWVIDRVKDLRGDEKVIRASKRLNEVPELDA